MSNNEMQEAVDKLKQRIREVKPNTVLKVCMVFVWLMILWLFLFTEFGRAVISLMAYVVFALVITCMMYWVYGVLREKEEEKVETRESVTTAISTVITNESDDENKEKDEEEKDEKNVYYLLDTSAFFVIQEYTSKRHRCISDLVYGNMTLNDNFSCLAEAIRTRRCYITTEVYEEIVRLEEEGQLERGVSDFIEEDIGIWKARTELPELQKMLSQKDIEEQKHYKMKHYKLIWNAVELAESVNAEVYLITSCKKMTSLAIANQVRIVDPLELEKEE